MGTILGSIAKAVGVNQVIASAGAGVLVVIINLIMSKFKIKTKVMAWTDKVEIVYISWLNKFVSGLDMIGYNLGVWVTGLFNNTKYLDKIWEHAVEPIFIIILILFKTIFVLTFEKLASTVGSFIRRIIDGLRSDNKNYKSNDEMAEIRSKEAR